MTSRSRRKPTKPDKKLPPAPKSQPTTTRLQYAPRPPLPQGLRPTALKPIDRYSSAYKSAAWKYTGFMVAMPILLVTSYVLFDRLALGNKAKSLRPTPVAPTTEEEE